MLSFFDIISGVLGTQSCNIGRAWSTLSTNACTVHQGRLVACHCPITTCKQISHGDLSGSSNYDCVLTPMIKVFIGLGISVIVVLVMVLFWVAEQQREMTAYRISSSLPKNLQETVFNALFGKRESMATDIDNGSDKLAETSVLNPQKKSWFVSYHWREEVLPFSVRLIIFSFFLLLPLFCWAHYVHFTYFCTVYIVMSKDFGLVLIFFLWVWTESLNGGF